MKSVYIYCVCFFVGVVSAVIVSYVATKRYNNQTIQFIKQSFHIFDEGNTHDNIARYHAQSYVQLSDGRQLNYDDLVKHADYVKSILASPLEIIYDDVIVQGNKVCTVHRARALKKDGQAVEIKVIAVHYLENGKIVKTDELTKVISGSDADKDLGSHH